MFKGREARLNHAIFQTLAKNDSLTIYEAHKQIKSLRGFRHTKYTNVSHRVRSARFFFVDSVLFDRKHVLVFVVQVRWKHWIIEQH